MKRVLLGVLTLLVVVGAVGFAFLSFKQPAQKPASTEKIEATPERLARGDYLVRHVVDCLGCHSEFDTDIYAMPPKAGTEGGGGFCFNKDNVGFPGQVCAQNITPDTETGIGTWTDGEILRAIREGVSKDGRALLPMMPYKLFRNLSDEDARSIVAYIRTLKPLNKQTPEGKLDFPVNLFVKFAPRPLEGPVAEPNHANTVEYGKYLSWACYDCHTQVNEKMETVADKAFGGGRKFELPGLTIVSANLTPHVTGMGTRTREQFISMFKAFADPSARVKVKLADNTLMPWHSYSGMTEADLGAVYGYLKTLPPIDNAVERRPPPKLTQR